MLKKILIILTLAFTLALPFAAQPVLAVGDCASTGDINSAEYQFCMSAITPPGINVADWRTKGINYFAGRVITIAAGLVGSVAVLIMGIGGFLMITSAGDDGQYTKGKGMMKFAAFGIVAVLGAYILVTTVQLLIKSIYGT